MDSQQGQLSPQTPPAIIENSNRAHHDGEHQMIDGGQCSSGRSLVSVLVDELEQLQLGTWWKLALGTLQPKPRLDMDAQLIIPLAYPVYFHARNVGGKGIKVDRRLVEALAMPEMLQKQRKPSPSFLMARIPSGSSCG